MLIAKYLMLIVQEIIENGVSACPHGAGNMSAAVREPTDAD
jgi:hypothetical protein